MNKLSFDNPCHMVGFTKCLILTVSWSIYYLYSLYHGLRKLSTIRINGFAVSGIGLK